jgi:hypothetical protein
LKVITSGLFSEPFFGKRYESFWSSVLKRTSRHQILIVSQTAAIGSNTLFPYTHGKNPQIKTQSASAWGITRPHKTEITNGLLRQFFPKDTDFKKVSGYCDSLDLDRVIYRPEYPGDN